MPMVRMEQGVISCLKLLKEVTGASSYSALVQDLLDEKLKQTNADTDEGYFPIGSVVSCGGKVLVIENIVGKRVVFDDGSFVINSSKECKAMEYLASSVEDYEGSADA